MAIDILVRPADGWLALIHDEQELDVGRVDLMGDGTIVVDGCLGPRTIGKLTDGMRTAAAGCYRAAVIRLHGAIVADAVQVPIDRRADDGERVGS